MNSLDEMKDYLDDVGRYLSADTVVTTREAEIRAGKFLEALYRVAAIVRTLDRDLFKLETYKSSVWHSVLSSAVGTVDAKKASAEANPTFSTVQEQYSSVQSDLNYLKNITRVFSDAHVFYRQAAKGELIHGNI